MYIHCIYTEYFLVNFHWLFSWCKILTPLSQYIVENLPPCFSCATPIESEEPAVDVIIHTVVPNRTELPHVLLERSPAPFNTVRVLPRDGVFEISKPDLPEEELRIVYCYFL